MKTVNIAHIVAFFFTLSCTNGWSAIPSGEGEAGGKQAESAGAGGAAETQGSSNKEGDADKHGGTLALKPLGDVDKEAVETAAKSIKDIYNWKIVLADKADLPQAAWYKPRKRYRAEKILAWLETRKPKWADKIMGITRKDISTTKPPHKDWGICGLAGMDGPASVISTWRVKKKLGKGTKKEKHKKYLRRLADLAAHEFGHQLGLPHCPNKGCIMEDAKGTVLTFDHSKSTLCNACRKILIKKGHMIP